MKTVYRTGKYKVVKDETRPAPQYHVYREGNKVHTAKSQVEATMWITRQGKVGKTMKKAVDFIEETGEYVSRPATEFDGVDPQEVPYEEQETTLTLTNDMWSALSFYILMTTKHREDEANTWRELSQEMEDDGVTPKYKNAESNADFWDEQNHKIAEILKAIDER